MTPAPNLTPAMVRSVEALTSGCATHAGLTYQDHHKPNAEQLTRLRPAPQPVCPGAGTRVRNGPLYWPRRASLSGPPPVLQVTSPAVLVGDNGNGMPVTIVGGLTDRLLPCLPPDPRLRPFGADKAISVCSPNRDEPGTFAITFRKPPPRRQCQTTQYHRRIFDCRFGWPFLFADGVTVIRRVRRGTRYSFESRRPRPISSPGVSCSSSPC